MFSNIAESVVESSLPAWLSIDIKKLAGTAKGTPVYTPSETLFDPEQVFEFYSR
jgi:hypothetical protein